MYVLASLRVPSLAIGVVAVCTYALFMYLMKGLDKEDIGYFRYVVTAQRHA